MVRICVEDGGVCGMDGVCAHGFAFGWFYIGGSRVGVMSSETSCLEGKDVCRYGSFFFLVVFPSQGSYISSSVIRLF